MAVFVGYFCATEAQALTININDAATALAEFTPSGGGFYFEERASGFRISDRSRTEAGALIKIVDAAELVNRDWVIQTTLAVAGAEFHPTLGVGTMQFGAIVGPTPGGDTALVYTGIDRAQFVNNSGNAIRTHFYYSPGVHTYTLTQSAGNLGIVGDETISLKIDGVEVPEFSAIPINALYDHNQSFGEFLIGGKSSHGIGTLDVHSWSFSNEKHSPPTEIPEPSTAVLLSAAALGAVRRRRRAS